MVLTLGHALLRRHALLAAAGIWVAAALCGCPDPNGQFEDFAEKLAQRPLPPAGDCGPAVTQSVEGTFFASLATQLAKTQPAVLRVDIATGPAGMTMVFQPLRVDDRETPAGAPFASPPAPIDAAGEFVVELVDVVLEGPANPITDEIIAASWFRLTGTACEDFLCGELAGEITEPAPITLEAGKSQFAMERLADGAPHPEPPRINCIGDLAKPLE